MSVSARRRCIARNARDATSAAPAQLAARKDRSAVWWVEARTASRRKDRGHASHTPDLSVPTAVGDIAVPDVRRLTGQRPRVSGSSGRRPEPQLRYFGPTGKHGEIDAAPSSASRPVVWAPRRSTGLLVTCLSIATNFSAYQFCRRRIDTQPRCRAVTVSGGKCSRIRCGNVGPAVRHSASTVYFAVAGTRARLESSLSPVARR